MKNRQLPSSIIPPITNNYTARSLLWGVMENLLGPLGKKWFKYWYLHLFICKKKMAPSILPPKYISNLSSLHFYYSRQGHHNLSPGQSQQTPNFNFIAIFQLFCSLAIMLLKWKLVKISQQLLILPRIILKHNFLLRLLFRGIWFLIIFHISHCHCYIIFLLSNLQSHWVQFFKCVKLISHQSHGPDSSLYLECTSSHSLQLALFKCHFPK